MRVIGVISEADLIATEAQEPKASGHLLRRLAQRGPSDEERRYDAHVVSTAMTSPAVTVDAYCTLRCAAELMLRRGVTGFPSSGAKNWSASSCARTWSGRSPDRMPT
jgi:hypothetical protein